MTEHLSDKQIELYRERSLSVEEFLSFDDHLYACQECRLRASASLGTNSMVETLRQDMVSVTPSHLDYDRLADYVDGRLDDVEREIADSHLSYCRECSAQAHAIEKLSAQIASSDIQSPSVLRTFQRYFQMRRIRVPLQIAAAAAAIALIVWATTLPLRQENSRLKAQLAEAQQRIEESQRDYEIARADLETLQSQIDERQNKESENSLALIDGSLRATVDKEGNIGGLDSLPTTYQQMIRTAFEAGRARTPQMIEELAGKSSVLMSGSNEGVAFTLRSPVGIVISTTRPVFRWQSVEGATGYKVEVFDEDFTPVATSPMLSTPSWTATSGLERGRIYIWQVIAIKDGIELKSPLPPAPEARFRVLEKEKAEEIINARKNYPDSHLIAGLVYAQAGLIDEAEREFQLLARNNPDSSVAQKLLRNIRSIRRR